MTEIKSVTVRMRDSIYQKLKKTANDKNISQGKLIENLIINIEPVQNNNEITSNDSPITLLLKYENYFLNTTEEQVREPKNYVFTGRWIWPRYKMEQRVINIEHLKENLKKEFKIGDPLNDCDCTYFFHVLYDSIKNRYIVVENFTICRKNPEKCMLHIIRCKFAMNLSEIRQHLSLYAENDDITIIESLLAPIIVDDDEVEMFLK